jgi:hypothetical protein
MTTSRTAALAAVVAALAGAPAAHASYGWPVKPFHAEHPVRGNFGDPRTLFHGPYSRRTLLTADGSFQFHFGVDISAPNGTRVYPVASGVVTRLTGERVDVDAGGGRVFEYWHITPSVRLGQRVVAYGNVLGRITRPSGHVHLTERVHGVEVNPLQRGHLTPYRDLSTPQVTRISAHTVEGVTELEAAAQDFPSMPVRGVWHGLPTTPARLAWRLENTRGGVVVPERVVYDVTERLPTASFWSVYVRGTHQNMTTFTHYYAFKQPGDYIFRLGSVQLATGAYRVVVTVTDIRGNTSSRTENVVLP